MSDALHDVDIAMTDRWGIHSHRIVLCFAGGKPQPRDDAPDLPLCKR